MRRVRVTLKQASDPELLADLIDSGVIVPRDRGRSGWTDDRWSCLLYYQ